MKSSLVVFGLLVATTAASYWHDELRSVKSMYSKWQAHRGTARQSRIQQSKIQQSNFDCKTVSWDADTGVGDDKLPLGYLHLCPTLTGDVCYTTATGRCCELNGLEMNITKQTVSVGGKNVDVTVSYVGSTLGVAEVCAHYGQLNNGIQSCPPTSNLPICRPRGCQITEEFCTNNSGIACDFNGCQECLPGYVPPRCCECDEQYLRAPDGSCKFVCGNCATSEEVCSVCSPRYANPPFCCDCAPPFVKQDDGTCACPEGEIEIDGTCQRVCTENTESCGSFPCSCKTGFKPPLCCECIFDETGSGDSYFESDGQCKQICTQNALAAFCNANSGCSRCEDSFAPPDCCKCEEPKQLIDGVCRLCLESQVIVDGKCVDICTNNVVPGSCTETSCTCLKGYTGPACCDCASGYIKNGDVCEECPPGQVPDSSGTRCICDQSKGKQIMVDGKCIEICENNVVNVDECTESACTCKDLFAAPDCCKCTNGREPVNGVCPVACLDNQDIIFLMDASTGNSNFELWGVTYAIELLTSALLRGTTQLSVQVFSYALNEHSTSLRNLTPSIPLGREVSVNRCSRIVRGFESLIRFIQQPRITYSGLSVGLLENLIRRDTTTTVITFAGTTSAHPDQNVVTIRNNIAKIKNAIGQNRVRFFGAGTQAENLDSANPSDKENYYNEVEALGDDKDSQSFVLHLVQHEAEFMETVTNMLYNNGILCEKQRDALLYRNGLTATQFDNLFYSYEECLQDRYSVSSPTCIGQDQYNFMCLNETLGTTAEVEAESELSLLTAMKELLEKLTN